MPERPYLLLPAVSPLRPPPIGPYYPLYGAITRETSRMAIRPPSLNDTPNSSRPGGEQKGEGHGKADAPARWRRPTPTVPIGTRITLSAGEVAECVRMGMERHSKNQEGRRANRRFASRRDDADISVQGAMGEYAFCRMFDLAINIYDTECRSALTERDFDATLMPERQTVDVKTATHDSAPLRVAWWKRPNPPDLYALLVLRHHDSTRLIADACASKLPTFEFRGFASAAMVFGDPESRVDTVDHEGRPDIIYIVPQARLLDREHLPAPGSA